MKHYRTTKHATERMQQRGTRNESVLNLIELSDVTTPVGRRLHGLRISRRALDEAMADGLPPSEAARLDRLVAIVSEDGALVSVANLHGRKSTAYRRRDRRAYWRQSA